MLSIQHQISLIFILFYHYISNIYLLLFFAALCLYASEFGLHFNNKGCCRLLSMCALRSRCFSNEAFKCLRHYCRMDFDVSEMDGFKYIVVTEKLDEAIKFMEVCPGYQMIFVDLFFIVV